MAKISVSEHYGKFRIRPVVEGQRISLTFNSKEEAELAALEFQVTTQKEKMGLKTPKRKVYSFQQASQLWLEKRAPQKRKPQDDLSIIKNHLDPFLKDIHLHEINQLTVDEYILLKKHLSKKTIANHITLLVSILNYTKDIQWIDSFPRIRKPKIITSSKDYRYLKTQTEIDSFLKQAKQKNDLHHILYKTAIYTGMRQGEIAGLKKNHVDFENRLIMVCQSFGQSTKNNETRFVPILDVLLEDLENWISSHPLEYVFPNKRGNQFTNSARIFDEDFHDCLKKANLNPIYNGKRWKPYITFHDLRHTFASQWAMRGGDIFKLQNILGHKSIEMTMRYSHLSPHAFKEDLSRFNPVSKTSNIINFKSK